MKIGDTVIIKHDASEKYVYHNSFLKKLAKNQENKIGIITEMHSVFKNSFRVKIKEECIFFWAKEHLELIDIPRLQMLELESIL